jgi:hypothetical protein
LASAFAIESNDPRFGLNTITLQTTISSLQFALISGERDESAESRSTGVALPDMTDPDVLDEFGRNGRDHPVIAAGAAHGRGDGVNGSQI